MSKIITLKSYSSRIEADIAKGLLKVNGIKSLVSADDAGGLRPFPFAYVQGVELKVLDEDFDRAAELLKEVTSDQ